MERDGILRVFAAEHFAHHGDELERAWIADAVEYPVGILAGEQHFLVPKDGEVLGDVALGCADGVHDVLDAGFLAADDAQDLQAQGMGDSFQGPGCGLDVLLIGDEFGGGCLHERFG